MMSICDKFVIICQDCIDDHDKEKVMKSLLQSKREIITISYHQMNSFMGNVLQLHHDNENFLVISKTAYSTLNEDQLKSIEKHCTIISPDIHYIEINGGGSVRCMLAELFN